MAIRCHACDAELEVLEQGGRRYVLEHECRPKQRQDAQPRPEPGTARGRERYG